MKEDLQLKRKEEYKTSLFYDRIDIQFRQRNEAPGMTYELLLEQSDLENILSAAWDNKVTEQSVNSYNRVVNRVLRTVEYLNYHTGQGKYFVKLNSVSSKDFKIIPITKENPQDVVNMLSNSIRIMECGYMPHKSDFPEHPFKLIFKPWVDIKPGCEFRAFIYKRRLVAVSRNDAESEPLTNFSNEEKIWIWKFIKAIVSEFFSCDRHKDIENIVFDCYVTFRGTEGSPSGNNPDLIDNVFWIEANPYFLSNPCCFTTAELENAMSTTVQTTEDILNFFKVDYPPEMKQRMRI